MSSDLINFISPEQHGNYQTGHDDIGNWWGNKTLIAEPSLCTLETCDLTMSSFRYRPTILGNSIYGGIFAILLLGQLILGVKHKTWGYMVAMMSGLVSDIYTFLNIHEPLTIQLVS